MKLPKVPKLPCGETRIWTQTGSKEHMFNPDTVLLSCSYWDCQSLLLSETISNKAVKPVMSVEEWIF